ncbi:MAG: HNH endonuclease [Clostridiales bacterium]|nr:HNH endonuclease [Clostridiales bacterium]
MSFDGYWVFQDPIKGESTMLHRYIFRRSVKGLLYDYIIHHKNGVVWDNRVANLEMKLLGHEIRFRDTDSENESFFLTNSGIKYLFVSGGSYHIVKKADDGFIISLSLNDFDLSRDCAYVLAMIYDDINYFSNLTYTVDDIVVRCASEEQLRKIYRFFYDIYSHCEGTMAKRRGLTNVFQRNIFLY